MNEEQYAKVIADLASNEKEHESFRRRLNDHDQLLREQNKIFLALEKQSSAMQSMNQSMGRVEKKVNNINARVETLEKEPADSWKKAKWEIIKYVLLAVVGLIVGWILSSATAAKAEAPASPSVTALYRIESDAMHLSSAPVRVTIIDLAVVDIDAKSLAENSEIAATVYFPLVPESGIEGIILFDGWHLASGHWLRTGENALTVTFRTADLAQFDGTVGLYLVMMGYME